MTTVVLVPYWEVVISFIFKYMSLPIQYRSLVSIVISMYFQYSMCKHNKVLGFYQQSYLMPEYNG